MAAPTVTIRFNKGNEGVPDWQDTTTNALTFCGFGSSDADLKDIKIPTTPQIIPELWMNAATDLQCTTYSNGTATADSGTTDGTTALKLVDSSQNFLATVDVYDIVHNTTDDTFAMVTVVDDNTTLTLDVDIMITGENYTIYEPGAVNVNQNVLQIYFATNATITPPELHAWDDAGHDTATSEFFNSLNMLKACETTTGVPGAGWCDKGTPPLIAAANGQGTALRGMEGYIICTTAATANTGKLFNIVCYAMPDNTNAAHTGVLTCHYTYT